MATAIPLDSSAVPTSVIRRILDRPALFVESSVVGCTCSVCEQRRSSPFECVVCGYIEVPVVHGCDCDGADEPCASHPDSGELGQWIGCGNHCFHGRIECPCCGGGEDSYSLELIDPWKRLRELRAALIGDRIE